MSDRSPLVAPSILSADFARLGEEARAVTAAGADWLHIDVMDGRFVPNLTIGPAVVAALRPHSPCPLDCHLMIVEPERYVQQFADAGADSITIHAEACTHLHRNLQQIRDLSRSDGKRMRAGVSLNPHTPIDGLLHVLELCDIVLIMSVNPGFGGQAFIPAVRPKIQKLRSIIDERGLATLIQLDGGVSDENARMLAEDGADCFVAGSAVFKHPRFDYAQAIKALRQAGAEGMQSRLAAQPGLGTTVT